MLTNLIKISLLISGCANSIPQPRVMDVKKPKRLTKWESCPRINVSVGMHSSHQKYVDRSIKWWNKKLNMKTFSKKGTFVPVIVVDNEEDFTLFRHEFDSSKVVNAQDNTVLAFALYRFNLDKKLIGGFIFVNEAQFLKLSEFSRTKMFVHEMGHILGLPHSPYRQSVMFWRLLDRKYGIEKSDLKFIRDQCKNS